jgi:hypothetical protein
MQQRQPRLGDIVDDYCPRERRLTNHAVVAMVGPEIKQTRCTTCDTEHEYKHAKVPAARKKKESTPALFKQVLANAQPEAVRAASGEPDEETPAAQPEAAPTPEPERADAPLMSAAEPGIAAEEDASPGDDEGPVHRRLIRATLPRPEGGQVQPRPIPQFTVRQPNKFAAGNARGARPAGNSNGPRPRAGAGRATFGRNATRDNFTSRPSGGGQHHGMQRGRPPHRGGGRPMRQGKKSK